MNDVPPGRPVIRFSAADLDLFRELSFDANPLHASDDYARKSPYGERVVFGALGALAVLGKFPWQPGQLLRELTADFHSPLFVGVDYAVEIEESSKRTVATVFDGRDMVMRLVASFGSGDARVSDVGALTAVAPARAKPAQHDSESLSRQPTAEGTYRPQPDALKAFVSSHRLAERGVSPMQAAVVMWCSYLIGMELPGERALFSRLKLGFENQTMPWSGEAIAYTARVSSFDARFNLAKIDAQLRLSESVVAVADLRAFVRADLPREGGRHLARLLPASDALTGRVALVTGASRGLGARLAQGLALQGCTVLCNFRRGRDDFDQMARELPEVAERLVPLQGDAADAEWCMEVRGRIASDFPGLDLLVCNAALSLRSMGMHANFARRIADYVAQSVALVSTPLSCWLEAVAERGGTAVVISSSVVEQPVAEWPHYVSAKHAVEGLTAVAALQYPSVSFMLVRPPRLLTDLTNSPSPMAREGTLAPEVVAATTVRSLLQTATPGHVQLLRSFES